MKLNREIKFICFTFIFYSLFLNNEALVLDRYYPRYHLAPPGGWMNDPNGFSVIGDTYHLYYQYNPNSSFEPGIAHWAHAISKDLFNWKHLPISMYPDQDYDKDGVFSGSALVENGTAYLFYTGNINYEGESPDHKQYQALALSTDGITATKYEHNPIITSDENQPDLRDPKVWKYNDNYYMVLGNSFNNSTLGRVLLYSSEDKLTWKQVSILGESDGFLGYMWECPDFFELDGHFVLLFSPQGMIAEGDKYRNLYQTGYIIGDFDYTTQIFTPITEFQELDHGHDFYATQTIKDEFGRRIVIAWLDMWEQNYPEQSDGFNGQMTTPRVLSLSQNGCLIQNPVKEINSIKDKIIYTGSSLGGTTVLLDDNAAEVKVLASSSKDFNLYIESQKCSSQTIHIKYDCQSQLLSLDRGGEDGLRRTKLPTDGLLKLLIYIDASSIEIFAGEGEVSFSSRIFPDNLLQVRLGSNSAVKNLRVTKLKRTVPFPAS